MHILYVILGSNLGDSRQVFVDALNLVRKRIGDIRAKSSLYETAPWGVDDQPDYLNQVVQISTELAPHDVINTLLAIEAELGRTRTVKWEARVIDLDLLFYDEIIVNDPPQLVIPHPFLPIRRFVLVPMAEIAPNLIHPVLQKSISELLDELPDPLLVKRVSK